MANSVSPLNSSNQERQIPSLPTEEDNGPDVRLPSVRSSYHVNSSYIRDATKDDLVNLRHVSDSIPLMVWLVAFTGAAERFAFYGITVPWRTLNHKLQLVQKL